MKLGILSFILTACFATMIFSSTWRLFSSHFHEPQWVLFLFSTSWLAGGIMTWLFTLAVRRANKG